MIAAVQPENTSLTTTTVAWIHSTLIATWTINCAKTREKVDFLFLLQILVIALHILYALEKLQHLVAVSQERISFQVKDGAKRLKQQTAR
jgi:hypothetical protein